MRDEKACGKINVDNELFSQRKFKHFTSLL